MRKREILKTGMMGAAMILLSTPAFARSIELKGAGTALWIFLIVGTMIVLLQLIPAGILFFSFVGTATSAAFKKEKKVEKKAVLPVVGTLVAMKEFETFSEISERGDGV